ncbi:MAG: hypothetical protein LBT62_07530 [Deltaproteobacteria bacterium]|nr:hypothetical protein [Deltaproteobacteria bacterium]
MLKRFSRMSFKTALANASNAKVNNAWSGRRTRPNRVATWLVNGCLFLPFFLFLPVFSQLRPRLAGLAPGFSYREETAILISSLSSLSFL